jgi:hypothetical protein
VLSIELVQELLSDGSSEADKDQEVSALDPDDAVLDELDPAASWEEMLDNESSDESFEVDLLLDSLGTVLLLCKAPAANSDELVVLVELMLSQPWEPKKRLDTSAFSVEAGMYVGCVSLVVRGKPFPLSLVLAYCHDFSESEPNLVERTAG